MMNKPTIIFLWRRGMVTQCYDDDGPNFGFSGRASYAMGMNKPNYPVPALRTDTLYLNRGRTDMNYLVDQGVEGTEIVYRGDTFDILSTLAIGWEWTDRSLSISYVTGIDKPNYPVPARTFHFTGDEIDPPNSVLSHGDKISMWWQVGSPTVMWFRRNEL